FMYPVIRKLVCKYNKWALLFMMVILRVTWAAFVMVLGEKYDFDFFSRWAFYHFPLFRLADFTIGALAGLLYKENKDKICFTNLQASILQVFTALLGIFFFSINFDSFPFLARAFFKSDVMRVFFSAAWVVFFMDGKGLVRILSGLHPLVALGNISGFAYLIHWPVVEFQGAVRSYLNLDFANWSLQQSCAVIFAEFVATIALSYLWLYAVSKKNP
ncbi:MAG: hypothetical protein K6A42_05585, partial [Treponema sp.]|nr:hypothetical protein [Treponema sp.]